MIDRPWNKAKFSQLIHVSFFKDRYGLSITSRDMTLWNLRDLILATTATSKNKLPLLKLATFGDQRTENNSLRHDANIISISGVEVDYDGEAVTFETALEYLRQAHLQSLVYTSPSNTTAKPRWRILLPTSRTLPPQKRKGLVARINGVLKGIIARESFVLSQTYYFGSISSNLEYRVEYTSGDFIDLRSDLDADAVAVDDIDTPHEPAEQLQADDPELVTLAMAVLPNDDVPQPEYNKIGMACWAATGGSDIGFAAFDVWAQKSKKYHGGTAKRWKHYFRSPPTRIGAGTIFYMADQIAPDWRNGSGARNAQVGAVLAGQLLNGVDRVAKGTVNGAVAPFSKAKSSLVVCAADIQPRSKDWLWEGHLLRGAQELLTGVPGLGKSQVQISFIACLTAGLPWPDSAPACKAMSVLMLTAEDTLDQEVIPRLIAARANLSKVHILKWIKTDGKNRQFLLNEDLNQLEKIVAEIGDVGMLTVDPITAFMGGKMDSHKATEVRSQLGPLKDFAEHTGIAVSSITHPPKAASQKAIDHFIGSQAFIAAGRIGHICIEEFKPDEDGNNVATGRILFANPKNNAHTRMKTMVFQVEQVFVANDHVTGIPINSPKVTWFDEILDITADEAVAASSGITLIKKRDRAQDRLQNLLMRLLADGEQSAKDVEAAVAEEGFSVKQLRTAKEKLGVQIVQKNRAWYWSLVGSNLTAS